MDPHLMHLATALGLAAAVGLNTTLPLLLIGLAHNLGLVHLAPPYDTLSTPAVLIILVLLVLLELAGNKIPGPDALLHTLQIPFTLAAGAIIAGTQAQEINAARPELILLLGLATAGGVHLIRATVRSLVHLLPLRIAGTALSAGEDAGALLFVAIALAVPPLAPLALLILFIVWTVLLYFVCRVLLQLAHRGLRIGEQIVRSFLTRRGGRPVGPGGAGIATQPTVPGDAELAPPLPPTADIWNDELGAQPVALPDTRQPLAGARPDLWDL